MNKLLHKYYLSDCRDQEIKREVGRFVFQNNSYVRATGYFRISYQRIKSDQIIKKYVSIHPSYLHISFDFPISLDFTLFKLIPLLSLSPTHAHDIIFYQQHYYETKKTRRVFQPALRKQQQLFISQWPPPDKLQYNYCTKGQKTVQDLSLAKHLDSRNIWTSNDNILRPCCDVGP
jgi:hypothetical protein